LNTQQVDDEAFGEHGSLEVKCASCGKSFQVVNPKTLALRLDTTRKAVSDITSYYMEDGRQLSLPKDKDLNLKMLEGTEKGTVYAIAKPRITIGRANADITVDDPLVSRLHCVLETIEDWVQLRDLGSANGTLVNDKPIEATTLESGSTFRIGNHVFQLLISPKEE
jgi:pSer/pThr/pTyr-binding forkhead associated (FHA) protein